tara:strand:- start:3163 stop:4470 length:1308 start_codon:yes stop_codon:yes gene_type:complete
MKFRRPMNPYTILNDNNKNIFDQTILFTIYCIFYLISNVNILNSDFYYTIIMLYFLLPSIQYSIVNHLSIQNNDTNSNEKICYSLGYYLKDIKHQIHEQGVKWDTVKRYTNPFEYIHTNVPEKKRSVSKYRPLSRSYFKMIEMTTFFKLLEKREFHSFQSFHLAEGPGGFIEALVHLRHNKTDKYYGMTILNDDNDPNIPGWKKSQQFLKDNQNVIIENGKDGTGNILNIENFDYCYHKYRSSMDICTGDGGFDFSVDFNKQEDNMSSLLFGQIAYALIMQKYKGSFILKVFDCFSLHTIDLCALLCSCYDKVYITKPQTSRYANSEKYIVCKNFQLKNTENIYRHLRKQFKVLLENSEQNSVKRYLSYHHSCLYMNKMEECNAIFGQQQIENIHYTLNQISNPSEDLNVIVKSNVQKCIQWCNKYNVLTNMITV